MNPHRGKILVIRGGAIGDFILTLPAIAALRRQFPEAHLEVLGYPHIVQLAIAGGLVDRVSSIEARALASFFARNGQLPEQWADYFSEFDIILSYLYDPDEIFKTNVGRCSPAQFIAGPHRADERSRVHAARIYLQPLERLAIFDADPVPRLRVRVERGNFPIPAGSQTASAREPVSANKAPPALALHPGSGSERKNWPELRWAELLQRLIDRTGFPLLLVGGEAEGERLQRLSAALPPMRTRVAQSQPLADLARLLSGCAGFIGHDSGISHLAAALELPALILWGESVEAIWRPPSQKVMVLRHPGGLDRLTVETVFEQVRRLWLI